MGTRRERVILDLEDHFSAGIVKAAAATGLLNHELDSLSRDAVRTRRSVSDIDQPVQNLGRSSNRSSNEVDRLSGRMRILADLAAILGPSLIPIAAVGIPAVAGLAAQVGFAAAGAGTMILAFQGIGDTLKAVSAASLNPTAANLEKVQILFERLSPEAQTFVAHLSAWIPELQKLRAIAGEGMFPGLTVGIDRLLTAAPHVEGVIAAISEELGKIGADAGASLSSEKWTDFLDFIAREAPPALAEMAAATGNVTHALAALWMAADPVNDDFSHWLVTATERLDTFATGLPKTQGYADFITYVEENGPQVAETLGAVANAALQIAEAASPLGGPALKGIEAMANLIADVANSDLGTPIFAGIAALALLNRTIAVTSALQEKAFGGPAIDAFRRSRAGIQGMAADYRVLRAEQARTREISQNMVPVPLLRKGSVEAQRLSGNIKAIGKGAAGVAGLTVATTGLADGLGLSNTASLALMGTLAGPWGAAVGGGVGLALDLAHANDDLEAAITRVNVAARSGDLKVMEDGIAHLKGEIDDMKHSTGIGDFLNDQFKSFGSFYRNIGNARAAGAEQRKAENAVADAEAEAAARRAAAAQDILADGFHATADGAKAASQSTEDFRDSLQKLNDTLEGRASMRDYEQALDDFTDRQKKRAEVLTEIQAENSDYAAKVANTDRDLAPARAKGDKGRVADLEAQRAKEKQAHEQRLKELQAEADSYKNSLDIGTQAGRDTQAALDNIAKTALAVAQTLQGADRAEFLAAARKQFIKAAMDAHMTRDAAKDLADQVLGLNTVVGQPKIVIDANGAFHVINDVQQRLNQFKDKKIRLTVLANMSHAAAVQSQLADVHGFGGAGADGMTIPGARHPYGDKMLILAAPGEELITNRHGEADRFRADRAAGRIPAYADGGTVGRRGSGSGHGPQVVRMSDDDVSRIVRGLATLRPLANQLTIQPHNYDEFLRQKERLERAAGIGGPPQ